jgi:hypothetical protein
MLDTGVYNLIEYEEISGSIGRKCPGMLAEITYRKIQTLL